MTIVISRKFCWLQFAPAAWMLLTLRGGKALELNHLPEVAVLSWQQQDLEIDTHSHNHEAQSHGTKNLVRARLVSWTELNAMHSRQERGS